MKFKKAGAAIIVATLTVAGSGYAWANENLFNSTEEQTETQAEETIQVITPENVTDTTEDSTVENLEENGTEETVTPEEPTTDGNEETDTTEESTTTSPEEVNKESEFPEIPEGYTAGNLIALKQAYENAGNATAKAAILRNAERAIAKFEANQATTKQVESTETEVIDLKPFLENTETVTPVTEMKVQPAQVAPVEATKESVKAQQKSLKEEHKQEKKELQEKHKTEKQALKAEHKAEKQAAKGKE